MTDTDQAAANTPTHVEGARRAEDIVDEQGKDADHMDHDDQGAGRPAGGHAAFDPMRTGQDKDGMKERGTVDPDGIDPSGGAV